MKIPNGKKLFDNLELWLDEDKSNKYSRYEGESYSIHYHSDGEYCSRSGYSTHHLRVRAFVI
jgi:hypothetical protein